MLNNKQLLRQTVLSCLLFFCWVMGPAGSSGLAQETPRRPNIVVILVDDLRSDDLACTGNPFVKTPHIDRIAREGMIFRNCFASTPLCSPVRASILTGLYAHKHGIVNNIDRSPQTHRMMTFPRVLHKSGYETGFVGKWHMGLDSTPRPGFDYWVGIPGQGTSFNPVINEQRVAKLTAGHVTDVLNERALQFVKRDREKPFLLYLPHKAVHPELLQREDGSISDPAAANFIPALRHRHLYEDAKIPRRPSYAKAPRGKSALLRKIGDLPPLGADTVTKDEKIRDRLRMLAAIDEGVGQLYDALKRNGQLDNTIFIVTSDHGYFYGEHGLSVERRLAYEESVHIPLLVRYPPLIKAGSESQRLVLSLDLAPTLLELAGARAPYRMHGRSLLPLMKGDTQNWRKSILIEYFSDTVFPRVRKMGYQAVRTERYKYIHYLDLEGMDELYDLKADPYEMNNIIRHHDSRPIIKRMKQELQKLLEETC